MAAINDLAFLGAALGTHSVKAMAQTLGVTSPISCRALLHAFAVSAQPKEPNPIWPIIQGQDESGLHVPVTGLIFSWSDPGATHYWAATNFALNLVVEASNASLFQSTTSQTSLACPVTLPYETSLRWDLTAKNQFGQALNQGFFGTADKPQGTPPPGGTMPQPSDGLHCSKLLLINCSSDHFEVHLWTLDATANEGWMDHGAFAAQYDDNGTCPAAGAQPLSVDLKDGHKYLCVVVAPDQQACGGINDPQNADCVAWPANLQPQTFVGTTSAPPFTIFFSGA